MAAIFDGLVIENRDMCHLLYKLYHDMYISIRADYPRSLASNYLTYRWATIIWASTRENLSSVVCEQHRRRPACASAQSDQRLCRSLFRKYHMLTYYR